MGLIQSAQVTTAVHPATDEAAFDLSLASALVRTALTNPVNRALLRRLPDLALPNCWLVAGCLFQAVWNAAAGRAPANGVKDYDIFYFDASDTSWEAEDRAITRAGGVLADLDIAVDLKNQARVHLWYARRFGRPYPRLTTTLDGIDRFLVAGTCIGISASASGFVTLYAPFGLNDCFEGLLRPNPLSGDGLESFEAKAQSYRARWPHLSITHDAAPLPRRDRCYELRLID